MSEPLVVEKKYDYPGALFDWNWSSIEVANQTFSLGIPEETFKLGDKIRAHISAASLYEAGDTWELLLMAIAKQLSPEMKARIDEDGLKDDRSRVQAMRDIGHHDLAGFMDEWYDLADDVQIRIMDADGEFPYPEIANEREIERKIADIHKRRQPYLPDRQPSQTEIAEMVCNRFNLVPKPLHEYEKYWIDRIIASEGFANYNPRPDGKGWHLENRPYGWLTRRHGAALMTHGYSYRFAFWQREIGDTRGHLWIQTDRGPLRLTDQTDSISLRSNFPVQVATTEGKRLFKLRASDVPDDLLSAGPDSKKLPPMRAKQKSPWFNFWN